MRVFGNHTGNPLREGYIAILLAFVMVLMFTFAMSGFVQLEKRLEGATRVSITNKRLDRVVRALLAYAQMPRDDGYPRGSFPSSLNDLVEMGLLNEDDLYDGWGHRFVYAVQNNPTSTDCLPDMIDAGNVPVAVVVSSGSNKKMETSLSSNLLTLNPAGDDLMVKTTLEGVAEQAMRILQRKLELWAQAASNYWVQEFADNCIKKNPPDDRHCCDPEKDNNCDGPSVFFPQNKRDVARHAYGSSSDMVKMVDIAGNPVTYSVTGSYKVTFTLTCPNMSRDFVIPESVR